MIKRYKYATKKDPLAFSAALDYLKMTKEFTGTVDDFLLAQDVWSPIPTNLDMYFTYRPYLEIMGLEGLLDAELKRIGLDECLPYNEKYGYYAPVVQSGNNIIQIPCPERSDTVHNIAGLVPYDEWETDEDAIKWLSGCVIEEIGTIPPADGVFVE